MSAATTAVAEYNLLTVQSSPPVGIVITSSTGDGGTTNYTVTGVAYGTIVNLVAPATDPARYTFCTGRRTAWRWPTGAKTITSTMHVPMTAVAVYRAK